MGRQPYTVRLALGRSALEPPDVLNSTVDPILSIDPAQNGDESRVEQYVQQYDSRGHPRNSASRAMARSLIRAQNDVLATVGVCVGVRTSKTGDQSSASTGASKDEGELIATLREENELGLLVSAVEIGLQYANHFWLRAMRARIQLYRSFSGLSFVDVLFQQYRVLGLPAFLFTGAPALFTTMCLDITREFFRLRIRESFRSNIDNQDVNRTRKRLLTIGGYVGDKFLDISISLVIEPLRIFATLQAVGLIPAWPPLPPLRSLVPFTASSPISTPTLGRSLWASVFSFPQMIPTSPVLLSYCSFYARHRIEHRVYMYLRRLMIKPDYPDKHSITAAVQEDLDEHTIPGIGYMQDPTDLSISKMDALPRFIDDVHAVQNWFKTLINLDSVNSLLGRILGEKMKSSIPNNAVDAGTRNTSDPVEAIIEGNLVTPQPRENVNSSADRSAENFDPGEHDASSSTSDDAQIDRPSNAVRVTTHEGGVETVTVEVDVSSHPFNTGEYATGLEELNQRSIHESSVVNGYPSMTIGTDEAHQNHRLTCLSTLPADSLATLLSRNITRLLVMPWETFVIRSVVSHFLSAASTPLQRANVSLIRSGIYSPGAWFGLETCDVSWAAATTAGGYMGRILMCVGLELMTSVVLWEVSYCTCMWLGKKYFGWSERRQDIPFEL